MGIRLVVAVTDRDWFDHLRLLPHLAEVNLDAASLRNLFSLIEKDGLICRLAGRAILSPSKHIQPMTLMEDISGTTSKNEQM